MPDTDDAFSLERTRHYAEYLRRGAGHLDQDAKTLLFWAHKIETRRPFETLAEEALDNAEKALNDALKSIQTARTRYKSLPAKKATSA